MGGVGWEKNKQIGLYPFPMVCYGWYGMYRMVYYGTLWHAMVYYGILLYGMVWYGVVGYIYPFPMTSPQSQPQTGWLLYKELHIAMHNEKAKISVVLKDDFLSVCYVLQTIVF